MKKFLLIIGLSSAFLSSAVRAEIVAVFEANVSNGTFSGMESAAGVSNLGYAAGSGLGNYGYMGSWATVDQFSRESLLADALDANSYLEFSFQTDGSTQITAFDKFYMDNDLVVDIVEGATTFKMGLAYDNGSGSFSETISAIDPQDISSGIDISGFSSVGVNSTVRLRVGFYDDVRTNPHSALYMVNSTLGGVENSGAVISGSVIPEPASLLFLFLGGLSWLVSRRLFAKGPTTKYSE
jgi:hypothetical protein